MPHRNNILYCTCEIKTPFPYLNASPTTKNFEILQPFNANARLPKIRSAVHKL